MNTSFSVKVALTALALMLSPISYAASFDCARAQTPMEVQICTSESLGVMDELIATLYKAARQQTGQQELKQGQRVWLKKRDKICAGSDPVKCEQFFIDRINALLAIVRTEPPQTLRVKALIEDMKVPALADLDPYSRKKLQEISGDIYTPWARKKIADVNIVSIPVVAETDDAFFLYFITHDAQLKSNCLNEINLMSGHRVQGPCQVGRRIGLRDDQVLVTYPWNKGDGFYRFKAGTLSQGSIVPVADDEKPTFFEHRIREQSRWSASADGEKLAVVARFVFEEGLENEMPYQQSLQLLRMRELTDPAALKNARPLVVYDRAGDMIRMSPELLPDEDEYYWESIFGIRWSDNSQTVFFDNEGSRLACIWEYDPTANRLYKIVPEAEAINPYPFTVDGQDFVVYSLDNQVMLAARP